MPEGDFRRILESSGDDWPALLEGGWLGGVGSPSIVACQPVSTMEGEAGGIGELPAWIARHAEQFPAGAAIGFLSYELARAFESLPLSPSPGLPDYSFAYYPKIKCVASSDFELSTSSEAAEVEVSEGFDAARFSSDIERIRKYIAAGDIYQANLTQQFTARVKGISPGQLYARLASAGALMRAFLRTPDLAIVSTSPERFFQVRGDRILTSPIKGTLARNGDHYRDEEISRKLLASQKDRAENVMIVDLLRNDLGRICSYETIRARLWEIDALPHLFHLVSHVEGRLRPSVGLLDILRALFPCGSITGAPKIRAMEILAGMEPAPRGVSMGAIGIIRGVPGNRNFEADFNVAIRTIAFRGAIVSFNVGCGIVYDSDPQLEWQEMLLKARPLLEGLGVDQAAATWRDEPRPVEA